MHNKLYFIAPVTESASIADRCLQVRAAHHTHSIPPTHATLLAVVMAPSAALEAELVAKYLSFPELFDHTEHITQAHIDAFPASVGLTLQDNTFTAMRKIHGALGMAGMHPKS